MFPDRIRQQIDGLAKCIHIKEAGGFCQEFENLSLSFAASICYTKTLAGRVCPSGIQPTAHKMMASAAGLNYMRLRFNIRSFAKSSTYPVFGVWCLVFGV